MKKYLPLTLLIFGTIISLSIIYIFTPSRCVNNWNGTVEYEKFFSNYEEFKYGENRYGKIIFLHPEKAKSKIIEICSESISKIKKENGLDYNINNLESLKAYLSYGDQMNLSKKEEKQIAILGVFTSIYEHGTWSFYL